MVARAGSESSSSALIGDPLQPAEEPADAAPTSAAAQRWRRITRALQRIRRLQRIWGLLGSFLQTFPPELRDRLRAVYPQPAPERRR
jgi:hypothetical protein